MTTHFEQRLTDLLVNAGRDPSQGKQFIKNVYDTMNRVPAAAERLSVGTKEVVKTMYANFFPDSQNSAPALDGTQPG